METEMFIVWYCTEANCLIKNQSLATNNTVTRWSKRGNGWMALVCQECGNLQMTEFDSQTIHDLQKQTRGQINVYTIVGCKELAERTFELTQFEPMSPETLSEFRWELDNLFEDELRELYETYKRFISGLAPRKSHRPR